MCVAVCQQLWSCHLLLFGLSSYKSGRSFSVLISVESEDSQFLMWIRFLVQCFKTFYSKEVKITAQLFSKNTVQIFNIWISIKSCGTKVCLKIVSFRILTRMEWMLMNLLFSTFRFNPRSLSINLLKACRAGYAPIRDVIDQSQNLDLREWVIPLSFF